MFSKLVDLWKRFIAHLNEETPPSIYYRSFVRHVDRKFYSAEPFEVCYFHSEGKSSLTVYKKNRNLAFSNGSLFQLEVQGEKIAEVDVGTDEDIELSSETGHFIPHISWGAEITLSQNDEIIYKGKFFRPSSIC